MVSFVIEIIWAIYSTIAIHVVVVMGWVSVVIVVFSGGAVCVTTFAICPSWMSLSTQGHRCDRQHY